MFILGLAIVFLIRFLWAFKTDFFIDEGFSGLMIENTFGEIVHLIALDYNTFFHYVYLKGWAEIFGNTHISLRLSSLFVSLLVIYVFYSITSFLIKQKGMRQAVTLLFAVIPCVLYYSFDVRMYGLESLWVLISVYYICKAYESTPSRRDMLFFAGALIAGFYTHALFAIHISLLGLYIVCNARRVEMRRYIPAFVLVAVSCLYWLGPLLVQMKDKASEGWLQFFYWRSVVETQRALFFFPMSYDGNSKLLTVSVFAFSLLALLGFWITRTKASRCILYLILATHIAYFVISPKLPVYYFRYLSYLTPLYILGFGMFIQQMRYISHRVKVGVLLGLATCCIYWEIPAQNVTLDARYVQPYLETYYAQGYDIVFESVMAYFPGKYYLNQKGIKVWIYAKASDLPQYVGKIGIDQTDYLPELDPNKKYVLVRDSMYTHRYIIGPEDEVIQMNRLFLIVVE